MIGSVDASAADAAVARDKAVEQLRWACVQLLCGDFAAARQHFANAQVWLAELG